MGKEGGDALTTNRPNILRALADGPVVVHRIVAACGLNPTWTQGLRQMERQLRSLIAEGAIKAMGKRVYGYVAGKAICPCCAGKGYVGPGAGREE